MKTLVNKKALSLLEIVISISLIAIAVIGFAQVFQVGTMSIYKNDQEAIATNLAVGLMSEIISKSFCDPTSCTSALSNETGGNRTDCGFNSFDDVDDYNGSLEGPDPAPRDIRGCAMAEFKGFTRRVNVSYVDEDMVDSATPTDFKRIIITVAPPDMPSVSVTEVKVNITE